MTAALETQGLGRRYGSQWALQGCTLEIPRGSVTALVGPNGAGKTTLLRLAVGLTRPSAGSVRVFGLDPHEQDAEALPRVGFLAQEHPRAQSGLGRRGIARPHRRARSAAQEEGSTAVGRGARAGRAHACAGQTAGAAASGRARRLPRPARASRIPPVGGRGGRRTRADCDPLVPHPR